MLTCVMIFQRHRGTAVPRASVPIRKYAYLPASSRRIFVAEIDSVASSNVNRSTT